MSAIDYTMLNDTDKLGLLQILYHDLKQKQTNGLWTARDIEQKELVIAETQRVYNRLKMRGN